MVDKIDNRNWQNVQLGDVATFIDYRGKTPPKTSSGIPLITAKIIKNNVIQTPTEFIEPNFYEEWMTRGIPVYDNVVFTTEAPLGEVAQIKTTDKIAFAQRVIIMQGKDGVLDDTFLFYALQHKPNKKRIEARSSGTTVFGIKSAELKKVMIDVPNIDAQREIGYMLSCLDDKIALNRRINATLEQMAQAIFFDFQNKGIGLVCDLSEIAEFNTDTYSEKDKWNNVLYLDTGNITNGVVEHIQHLDLAIDKLPSRARRKIKPKDIVYSTVRPIQRHYGIISNPKENMLVSTGFAVIRSASEVVCNEYIYLFLSSDEIVVKLQQLAEQSVSTYPSIKPSDIGSCKILIPSDKDGFRLRNELMPLFDMIASNNEESSYLATIRVTLLPRLMSGELSVPTTSITK